MDESTRAVQNEADHDGAPRRSDVTGAPERGTDRPSSVSAAASAAAALTGGSAASLNSATLTMVQRTAGNRAATTLVRGRTDAAPAVVQRDRDLPPPAPSPSRPADQPPPPGAPAPSPTPQSPGPNGAPAPPGASAPSPTPQSPGPNGAPAPGGTQVVQSPGEMAARTGGPMGPDPFGSGYVEGNQSVGADPAIAELFEARADPDAKAQHQRLIAQAEAARLDSLQYKYTPGGFTNTVLALILPGDAVLESLRRATTQNAYASGASFGSWSGVIAGIQTGIEFIRGIAKAVGDVVGAASTVLAAIAGAAALFAKLMAAAQAIGIPTGPIALGAGKLAAASLAASGTLGLIKTVLDLADMLLGTLQILGNIARARLTDDPIERARLCQLMKKEAGDFSSNLVMVGVSAATAGVGAGLGRAIAGGAARQTARLARGAQKAAASMGQKMTWKTALRGSIVHLRWVRAAKSGDVAAMGQVLRTRVPPPWGTLEFDAALRRAAPGLLEGRLASVTAVQTVGGFRGRTKLFFDTSAPAPGAVAAGKDTQVTTEGGGPGGAGPAAGADAGPNVNLTYDKVAYWPSVLEQMGTTREWIHNAQSRMKDQYVAASEDAGEKKKAVRDARGGLTQTGTRMRMAGGAAKAKAEAGENVSTQIEGHAEAAEDKGKEAAGKAAEAKDSASETRDDVKGAETQARSAQKSDPDLLDRAKAWAYEKLRTYIFKPLSTLQQKVSGWVLSAGLAAAGLDQKDMDLAGIRSSAGEEADADRTAKGDAADLEAQGDQTDDDIATLLEGASAQEEAAIHGMVDSGAWIDALDGYDQALAQQQDHGSNYVSDATAHVKEQAYAELVSEAYIAPIINGAAFVKGRTDAIPEQLREAGMRGVEALVADIALQPGAASGPAALSGRSVVDQVVLLSYSDCGDMAREAAQIAIDARDLIGTDAFASAQRLAARLDAIGSELESYPLGPFGAMHSRLEAIALIYKLVYGGSPGTGGRPGAGGGTREGAGAVPTGASAVPPEH